MIRRIHSKRALAVVALLCLLVAFLSELLWLLESKDLLWAGGGAEVDEGPDGGLRLRADANAVRYDPTLHGRGVEVKAVTYHGLKVDRLRDGRWRIQVILDV